MSANDPTQTLVVTPTTNQFRRSQQAKRSAGSVINVQKNRVTVSRKSLLYVGAVLILLGFSVFLMPLEEVPPLSSLSSASGVVRSVEETGKRNRRSVAFRLKGHTEWFGYTYKSGQSGTVYNALRNAETKTVTIKFDKSDPRFPSFENEPRYPTYAISVSHNVVRSYEDVVSSWSSDNAFRPWIAALFFVLGALNLGFALQRRNDA